MATAGIRPRSRYERTGISQNYSSLAPLTLHSARRVAQFLREGGKQRRDEYHHGCGNDMDGELRRHYGRARRRGHDMLAVRDGETVHCGVMHTADRDAHDERAQ